MKLVLIPVALGIVSCAIIAAVFVFTAYPIIWIIAALNGLVDRFGPWLDVSKSLTKGRRCSRYDY